MKQKKSASPHRRTAILGSSSGQSLVEVMVALFILTTGILGILTLLAQSIFLSKTLSNETTATYLASEGIEVTKNLIDHDVYQHLAGFGPGWGACFAGGGGTYAVDYLTTSCPPPAGGTEQNPLYYDPTTHMYGYNGSNGTVQTPFTRVIHVTVNGNEITVQSIVTWQVGLGQQNITLEDHFYNWHP